MNKILAALLAGIFAATLSVSAFAADATKPVVVVKKDSGIKASVKKLATPSAKKTEVKLK